MFKSLNRTRSGKTLLAFLLMGIATATITGWTCRPGVKIAAQYVGVYYAPGARGDLDVNLVLCANGFAYRLPVKPGGQECDWTQSRGKWRLNKGGVSVKFNRTCTAQGKLDLSLMTCPAKVTDFKFTGCKPSKDTEDLSDEDIRRAFTRKKKETIEGAYMSFKKLKKSPAVCRPGYKPSSAADMAKALEDI